MPIVCFLTPQAEGNLANIANSLHTNLDDLRTDMRVRINALLSQWTEQQMLPPSRLPAKFFVYVPYGQHGAKVYLSVTGGCPAVGNDPPYNVNSVAREAPSPQALVGPTHAALLGRAAVEAARTGGDPAPLSPPTTLFQGCNTFSGAGMQTAVTATTPQPTFPAKIDKYVVTTAFSDISDLFQVGASVSANEFLVDSVDARASFMNSLNITQYSVVIAIRCNVSAVYSVTSQVNLLPTVTLPNTKAGLAQFVTTFGDCWVSSITTAAEFAAFYVYYASSLAEQEAVSAQISGKIVDEEGTASAGFSTDQQSKLKQITTRSVFIGELFGYSDSELDAGDIADSGAIAQALNAAKSSDYGWISAFSPQPYETVMGLKPIIDSTQLPANRDAYRSLAPWADTLTTRLDQVETVLGIYAAYGYTGDSTLLGHQGNMKQDQGELIDQIQELCQYPLVQPSNPVVAPPGSLTYGTPVPQFTLTQQTDPLWGGSSGQGNTAVYVDSSLVLSGCVLQGLTIDGGDEVNWLELSYTNLAEPIVLGRQEGGTSHPWSFQAAEGEQVTEVSVTAGALINQLTVTTNKGTVAKWPLNPHSAPEPAPWSVPAGSAFLGFAVTYDSSGSDHCLKTLTPVAVTLTPASWSGDTGGNS